MLKVLLLAGALLAQVEETPEDLCKAANNYWSEDLEQCFVVAEMDGNELLVMRKIRVLEALKAQRLREQQEYNASGKASSIADLYARIAEIVAAQDAADDADVKATYQAEVDALNAKVAEIDAFDVSEHGAIISALSTTISKHKEELDKLLTQ